MALKLNELANYEWGWKYVCFSSPIIFKSVVISCIWWCFYSNNTFAVNHWNGTGLKIEKIVEGRIVIEI